MGVYTYKLSLFVRYCPFVTCVCDEEGCGLLADGDTSTQLTNWGYAVTARYFLSTGRLLVVLTEGRDFCSLNRENWSETCENGEQGVSFAGF